MAYLDPVSNPGSKPQRLGATNCNVQHSENFLAFPWDNTGESDAREITEPFRKIREQWFKRKYLLLIAACLYPT